MQIINVFMAANNLAISQLKNNAAESIEFVAVTFRCISVNANNSTTITGQDLMELSLECTLALDAILGEASKYSISTDCIAGYRAPTRRMP